MPSRQILNEQRLLQTTNATQQTAFSLAFPTDAGCQFQIEVQATSTAVDCASWRKEGAARRVGSGNVAAVGGVPTDMIAPRKSANASAWDVSFQVSGANALMLVTGAAGVTIEWIVRMTGVMSLPNDNPPQDPGAQAGGAQS